MDELAIDVLVLGRRFVEHKLLAGIALLLASLLKMCDHTRGMRELENTTKGCAGETIIGPVSEYCMKHARCHVILIRGKTPPLDFEGSRHTISESLLVNSKALVVISH